ncbi:unnamed protein product [Leptosia nina]|uniref:Uncharacterized protein n=1 Tax=Leptosia nina TaxID=320188 RepID=A0AAV1JAN3_9NEOP
MKNAPLRRTGESGWNSERSKNMSAVVVKPLPAPAALVRSTPEPLGPTASPAGGRESPRRTPSSLLLRMRYIAHISFHSYYYSALDFVHLPSYVFSGHLS